MLARECRNLPQQQLAARGRLQHPEHVVNGGIRFVDLVQKQETRNLLLFELAQNELKLRHLLLVELAHHDRGVDRRQRHPHVVDEFNRAREIGERVGVAHEGGAGHREFDAHLVIARFLAGVADRIPRLDRTLALYHAGAGKDRFEQGGLAALEWAHQRDAPWTRGSCAVLCHFRLPNSPRCGLLRDRFRYRFRRGGGFGKRRARLKARARTRLTSAGQHAAQKRPPPSGRPFELTETMRPVQGPGRSRSSATPTARLSPTELSTETGCNATVRLEPPTRTLAPRPAAMVTSPLAPK